MKRRLSKRQGGREADKFKKAADKYINDYLNQLGRIHKAVAEYSEEGRRLTSEDFYNEWLGGLSSSLRRVFKKEGYENNTFNILFNRYVMERNDYGLAEFLKANLSKKDYNAWSKMYFNKTIILPSKK